MTAPMKPPVWLALDPGTTETGFVFFQRPDRILDSGTMPNEDILGLFDDETCCDRLVIEMISSYGMAVGRETFETVFWIGRFYEAWLQTWMFRPDPLRILRKDVKLHLCHDMRAKDTHIWTALTDRFGLPGTKKDKGVLYGVRSHARAALALAVTADDKFGER